MNSNEEEDNFRMRKANEHLTYCREAENQARIALAQAVKATANARTKHETLFHEVEARAVARKKSLSTL